MITPIGSFHSRLKRTFSLLILLLGAAGCGHGLLLFGGVSPSEVVNEPYRLRVGDELDISVWGQTEMTRRVQIREDGTFLLPPIGSIEAAGRSLELIEKEVQDRLSRQSQPEEETKEPEAVSSSRRVVSIEEASKQIYRFQWGDELDISVWSHDDLNRKAQIREDGTFSFPLIGSVKAISRSPQEVEQEIQERLDQEFLVNPQVTVRLYGARFSVLGEVQNPGWYSTEGTTDLLTAISQAGGVTKSGSSRVEIIRGQGKEKVTIPAHIDRILEGEEPSIPIFPRDTIYVRGHALEGLQVTVRLYGARFSVLGEVERPGSYPIEGAIDLLTAISQAGGTTKFGSAHVEVIRGQGIEKFTIHANVDRILRGRDPNLSIQPHDTIYVRRRLF